MIKYYIKRLLFRNIFLISGVAFFLAVLVFFATRDEPETYSSASTVYTGMVTVIAAFMAGLVLISALIILIEVLDNSIKFPARFAKLSGLELIGAFPRITSRPGKQINYPLLSSLAIGRLVQRIRLENLLLKNSGESPFVLFIISTREKEGKTYLAVRMVEKLRATGSKVLFIKPLEKNASEEIKRQFFSFNKPMQVWDFEYTVPENFISINNISGLLRDYSLLTKDYHYLVVELPALLIQDFPAAMTRSGHLSILVGRATRTWNRADEEALRLYRTFFDHTVLALLNGCQVDQMESVIGEIPKRKSPVWKLIGKQFFL